MTALAAIHDLDLAARFCDELVLLSAGEILANGTPEVVLTEPHLEEAFDVRVAVTSHPVTDSVSVTALSERPSGDSSAQAPGEREGANTEDSRDETTALPPNADGR